MAKLMLVEDDNNLREIYEARLQAEGYTIVTARDGEEALVVAKAEKPELVIADVMMPKISGFEMLDIMRNTDGLKDVKVIMLTALGQADDQQRADKLGADRYLVKSQVTLEDIVKVTHDLLSDEAEAPAAAATTAAPEAAQPTAVIPVAAEPAAAAQSTAQESNAVEARIEDFVAGASQDATPPPAAVPTTAPEPAVNPAPTTAAVADDKLMSEAVDTLVASAPAAAPPQTAPTPTTAPVTTADDNGAGTKKIISPISSEPKKDINTLLALEDAKEKAAEAQGSTAPKAGPAKTTDGAVDPNSVAL